jgi:hypothetical protein
MDNPDKLATFGTHDTRWRQTKQKHNTIYVGHHYIQTNTNNVNKTWTFLQTTPLFIYRIGGFVGPIKSQNLVRNDGINNKTTNSNVNKHIDIKFSVQYVAKSIAICKAKSLYNQPKPYICFSYFLLWSHFWIDFNKFYTKAFRIVYILIVYLLIMFIWVVFICA